MLRLTDLPKEYWEIVETIFSGFDGAIIIDENGKILAFSEYYARESGLARESVLGRHIQDVFPNSRLFEVIKNGKPIIADLWVLNGKSQIVSRVPIVSEGKVIGAAGYNVFRYIEEARNFASKFSNLHTELAYYKEAVKELTGAKYSLAGIIGKSEAILEAKEKIRKVAAINAPTLIYGETGTGKELFAHALHQESPRRDGPLIRVNCASIPDSLMESEFFGYEEGAFTGARRGGKAGKFELAHKGSIFLDEISDLPYSMQPKLLRVLQEKEFERVGGTETKVVDVRIISATNMDLRKSMANSLFREDLFYRLNVFMIRVPPLRERLEDMPLLVEYFIKLQNMENGTSVETISREAMDLLVSYHWPGNVRELKIAIERACLDAQSGRIEQENLIRFGGKKIEKKLKEKKKGLHTLKKAREEAEKAAIISALSAARGNKQAAANILGIHRTSLYYKLREYNMLSVTGDTETDQAFD